MQYNASYFANSAENEHGPQHAISGGELFNEQESAVPGEWGAGPAVGHDLGGRATRYKRSYVNDAVDVLRAAGRPLKLQELQAQISARRNKAVSLGSLKVCLSRYVDSEDPSKHLARLAPGLFALASWERTSALAHRAAEWRSGTGHQEDVPEESLRLFLWRLPARPEIGFEQRVCVRAVDEADAYLRLAGAGVPYSALGELDQVSPTGTQNKG